MKLKSTLICFIVSLFFVAPAFCITGGTTDSTDIFTDALYSEAAPFIGESRGTDDSKVIRSRFVRVNFSQVAEEPTHRLIHFNLFHDALLNVQVDRVVSNPTGSTTYMGKSTIEKDGSAIFTVKNGVMVGSFSLGAQNFIITYLGNGVHEVQETDHSKYAGCEEPEHSNPLPMANQVEDSLSTVMDDDGSTLDIMVVYTATARSAAGGTTAMQNLIDQAVNETNTGYTNSFVNPRVNLVHTYEVNYSETGFNWSTCLNRLKGKTDGYMDEVHEFRDMYKADMVVMIVNNGAYCGLAATIMATESQAFCLVARTCTTGYYSFAHEMGHLQGARHDRYVDPTENSPYTYNHGYTYAPGRWRTIMGYNTACTAVGVSCARLNYWSNPNVLYGGVAMGNPGGIGEGADNHRCLNNTAYTVANFRVSGGSGSPYCTSSATSQAQGWVSAIEMGDFYNTSGASGYTDFTSKSVNMTRGTLIDIALTASYSGSSDNSYWKIWIDYNLDGDFDDNGEMVFSGSGTGTIFGGISVPALDGTGTTRMRIAMQSGSYRSSPCGTYTYGEVEDYSVNIL